MGHAQDFGRSRIKFQEGKEKVAKKALPLNKIQQGDCIEVLSILPEKSVDVIFADPPYNLQLSQELFRPNRTRVDGVEEEWDQFDSLQAYDEFSRAWLTACQRVLKDSGTLWVIGSYHNIFRVGTVLQDLGYWILNDVIWVKNNPTPNFRGVRFTNAHESLIWCSKSKGASYTFNHHAMKAINDGKQMRSDWYLPLCSGSERLKSNGKKAHPTQKPEALLYRVLQASSNPGDIVLDPFFGTGTTGVVAKKLHRKWIGIEREKKYIKLALKRIENTEVSRLERDVFDVTDPRWKQPRIPFSSLLENGLIRPGQRLYFQGKRSQKAVVLSDGTLKRNGSKGSIHKVGREILGGSPCNGWELWYFADGENKLQSIDVLRQQIREEMAAN